MVFADVGPTTTVDCAGRITTLPPGAWTAFVAMAALMRVFAAEIIGRPPPTVPACSRQHNAQIRLNWPRCQKYDKNHTAAGWQLSPTHCSVPNL